MFTMTGS